MNPASDVLVAANNRPHSWTDARYFGTHGQPASEFSPTSTFGVSERHVADLGDKTVLFMIAPGQSGHPLYPHYRDLVQKWRTGEMLTLTFDKPAVATNAPSRTNANGR